MKIYTKKGDKGMTGLVGGKKVSKDDIRVEAYGTVDELNAWIGLLRDTVTADSTKKTLLNIQHHLFNAGSLLATPPGREFNLPKVTEEHIRELEVAIDEMEKALPALKAFILPGGTHLASYCHIARTVCRRAERRVVGLANEQPVEEVILRLLNRLSDYLFVLSRKLVVDEGAEEIFWKK